VLSTKKVVNLRVPGDDHSQLGASVRVAVGASVPSLHISLTFTADRRHGLSGACVHGKLGQRNRGGRPGRIRSSFASGLNDQSIALDLLTVELGSAIPML
jgi:hypothetical protein